MSGKVINVNGDPYGDGKYNIVDIETSDGFIVRHFYVSPSLTVGKKVEGGKTIIGKAQNIAQNKLGMTNHVHVETRDPSFKAYNKYGLKGFKDIKPNFQF